ncbi:MAG: hypothetical protein HRU32_13530 [Rhodobacteraceae bacterium]|nr:hypothetical protein [Paracoccaceae bacterium]
MPGLIGGGWVAARVGSHDTTMLVSFAAIAAAITLIGVSGTELWVWLVVGLLFGVPGGLIMALPARAVEGPARSIGFAIYFTIYYIVMPLGPPVAAATIAATGQDTSVLMLAIAALGLTALCLVAFRVVLPAKPQTA